MQPVEKTEKRKISQIPTCNIISYSRKFALNVGVEFLTPENLFLGDKKKVQVQGFSPTSIPT